MLVGKQFSWAGSTSSAALLLEAAQFQNKGGWVVDQQFMDEMGSSFLLAHGLGKPVEDAIAEVKFPEKGIYRIWVRTRDWVGPWKKPEIPETKKAYGSPGIFRIGVGNKTVKTIFGIENEKWHWQDGGTINIQEKETTVSLIDYKGFEGRCAAIFFSKDLGLIPPNEGKELQEFRQKWHGYSSTPKQMGTFDLVVVGAGMAGLGAAIAAAREGVKVALIQDRPVVGGNNSSEIRVWLAGRSSTPHSQKLGSVIKQLEPKRRAHVGEENTAEIYEDENKLALLKAEKSLSFFPSLRMNEVQMEDNEIKGIIAEDIESGEKLLFKGKLFADCTGDGCVGAAANADFEMTMNNEDGHMGRCNLWNTTEHEQEMPFPKCTWALNLTDKPFPGRKGYAGGATKIHYGLEAMGRSYWESGMNHDPIKDGEYIRDWNFRAMYGAWDALKNVDKAYPNRSLNWAAYISGKRESRRLMGDIVLTENDILFNKKFDDAIVPTGWDIDIHKPDKEYDKGVK